MEKCIMDFLARMESPCQKQFGMGSLSMVEADIGWTRKVIYYFFLSLHYFFKQFASRVSRIRLSARARIN